MDHGSTYILMACFFGFLMAWGVGANDVANAMGTSVGSKAITIRQALAIATIFEFAGAFLAGGEVTDTIRQGIVDPALLVQTPELFVYGMLSSLLAAGVWLLIATCFGWPVSTTHTIVGAIVGFGCVNIGFQAVKWVEILYIVSSWIISPIMGGLISYALFMSVHAFILNKDNPSYHAKRLVPVYIFIASFIISMVTLTQGLKYVGPQFTFFHSILMSIGISALFTLMGIFALRKLKLPPEADKTFHFTNVERIFSVLMVFTACTMAFAHGSNDVANAIGPLAAIADVVTHNGVMNMRGTIPSWILFMGAIGIVTGLISYGHKVIATVGQGITELTPTRGFAATFAAACTVVIASGTGLPVSTTHTLVGAVLGVGLARGIGALNLNVISTIFMSWIITLPAGAILSVVFFHCIKWIFQG